MNKIKDICAFVEGFAPLGTAMDFDNVGLLVGDGESEVTRVLVALDITPEVIIEAEDFGAQLIISHHPVIFDPLRSIAPDSVVYKLIERRISALCLHTNLDLSPIFGVNTCLADAVGVRNYSFVEGECLLIGELEKEISCREFAETVKAALGCGGLRFTNPEKRVKKVAICSGSGGDLVFSAKENSADVLLTGEIKHHEILDANRIGTAVVEAGHFHTENIVVAPFAKKLAEAFPELSVRASEKCTDGIHFI